MDQIRLGDSGLTVSPITIGCMSFGTPGEGPQKWSLGEADSRAVIRRALDAGLTTFDTADMYSQGRSEEILGAALADLTRRDEVVIATKVFFPTGQGPYDRGLSRKHIMSAIDASLTRLGTDYVDLYQIHRWDYATPIEETMEALHDVVKAGKARYLGASSMWTWQFAKAQYTADRHGWTRFVSMQDHYNLLMREEEREMHPFCLDQGVGVIPWSPMARGKLTRPLGQHTPRQDTDRPVRAGMYSHNPDADATIIATVADIARSRGVSMAQVALAWVMAQPAVTSPIVGVTKTEQLDDAIAAIDLTLSQEEIARLEAPYTPRRPEGHE
ncbi:aldo/keto reductase [Raineyella sp. LH-20]|uniref:aldo/keto reductase n=1 Tax=Raineyella sp. LH-20 TaxID=3081204 RepID=UPI002955C55D|nr:aldo/keto reductase [Raineyella sp. LH-20]WOP19469.1 aldo/keto reductase [Raineyella sp. LH-20]